MDFDFYKPQEDNFALDLKKAESNTDFFSNI